MPNHPMTPKGTDKPAPPKFPQKTWGPGKGQKPLRPVNQPHLPMGLGKHRKSFGHV